MNSPRSVREIKKALGNSNAQVLVTCVLHNLTNDEYEPYAIVNVEGGREIQIGDTSVFLLSPEAPLSEHLLDCRLGDIFLCYQVVSVDGSPILSEAGRQYFHQGLTKQEERRDASGGRGTALAPGR